MAHGGVSATRSTISLWGVEARITRPLTSHAKAKRYTRRVRIRFFQKGKSKAASRMSDQMPISAKNLQY